MKILPSFRRHSGAGTKLRIAVISTPRSGNTWLRSLLAGIYGLEQFAVHTPDDLDWSGLPNRCIVQLHWHWREPLTSNLAAHGFRAVTISRHPLDVLLSILRFSRYEPETARWLDGESGGEAEIRDAAPLSPSFEEYATSSRAFALLSISREWWNSPDVCRVRYEDLVYRTFGELERLGETMGAPATAKAIAGAVHSNTFKALQANDANQHFWQGQPGLWKKLLPAATARRIAKRHEANFRTFDYLCDPDPALSADQAERNWQEHNNDVVALR